MSEKKSPRIKIVLGSTKGKLVRMSHLHVHEARMNEFSEAEEFSTMVLIPKANTEDVAAVKAAIEQLKKVTWLDDKKKVPPGFWNPLRDGDVDTKQDGSPLGAECQGHYVINCKTGVDSPPDVVGTMRDAKGKFVRLEKNEIKSGDWGRVSVNLGAYTKGTGGVGCDLSSVQRVRDGDPLGNKSSAENDFADFEDEDEDELVG